MCSGSLDLVVIGAMSAEESVKDALYVMARGGYRGRVMLFGGRGSEALHSAHALGVLLGLPMLPPLGTPFGQRTLTQNLANFLPVPRPPRVALDVEEALHQGWFELWYEPKIEPRSLALRGSEARLRLRHPAWGILGLDSVAPNESDRAARSLAEFAIDRAIGDAHHFAAHGMPVEISLDLPMHILVEPEFPQFIVSRMAVAPAQPFLIVEIDSADAIRDTARTREIGADLRAGGVGLSIETIGPHDAALVKLVEDPIFEIKVGMRAIRRSVQDAGRQSAWHDLLERARRARIRLVAHGVARYTDVELLGNVGFDLMQGSLLPDPMEPARFMRALTRWRHDLA